VPCILCGVNPPIRNSHVIPRLAFRRLRWGSPLDAFVHTANLNRLIQDGWKADLLCGSCESLFSRWETWFANYLLDPFEQGRARALVYDERLGLFSASLHFRHLEYQIRMAPGSATSADLALRDRLRGMCATLSPTDPQVFQYIQLLEPVRSIGVFAPGINSYLFEAIDPRVVQNVDGIPSSMSFVKLQGVLLVACDIDLERVMPQPGLLTGHRINAAGRLALAHQSGALLTEAEPIVASRVEDMQLNYGRMSPRQLARIRERIATDPDRQRRRARRSYELDMYLLAQSRLRDRRLPQFLWRAVAAVCRAFNWVPPARRP
jgi:hypothetical protein